jgi:hypothetical protein
MDNTCGLLPQNSETERHDGGVHLSNPLLKNIPGDPHAPLYEKQDVGSSPDFLSKDAGLSSATRENPRLSLSAGFEEKLNNGTVSCPENDVRKDEDKGVHTSDVEAHTSDVELVRRVFDGTIVSM